MWMKNLGIVNTFLIFTDYLIMKTVLTYALSFSASTSSYLILTARNGLYITAQSFFGRFWFSAFCTNWSPQRISSHSKYRLIMFFKVCCALVSSIKFLPLDRQHVFQCGRAKIIVFFFGLINFTMSLFFMIDPIPLFCSYSPYITLLISSLLRTNTNVYRHV